MDFQLSPEQQAIYEYGNQLSKKYDRKYWMKKVDAKEFPAEMYQQVAEDGFLGIMVPEAYGGAGLGMTEMALFMEGLSNNGIPLLSLVICSTMSLPLISMHGTEEQKSKYLPEACEGKKRFCFAITESEAGSNSMNIATFAKRDGDKFILSGSKTYITDADNSDYGLVVARTTPLKDTDKKTQGFSLFIVDMKDPKIEIRSIPMSLTLPENQCQVFFDGVELSEKDIVGTVDRGFDILFDTLNPERIILAALCSGLGTYALNQAVEYASERVVFKGPIGAYQGLQHPLAMAKTEIEMSRLMTYKAAWAFDKKKPAGEFSNMAKYSAAEAAIHACDASLQCFGGNGFTKEYGIFDIYPLARLLRTAPLNREIILSYIGEKVMGLPRSY